MNLIAPLVLIVDIENLKPPLALERSISNAFSGIGITKIAVGNWKLLSCDRELKSRGYHLFHIPQGQDAADIEICDLTNLLGNGTKIVIVSNDNIFIDLAARLHEIEDKSIYIVRKLQNKYCLSEWMYLLEEQVILESPAKTENSPQKFISDRELVNVLKTLIKEHNITTHNNLGSKFKDRYGIDVKEAIKSLNINQTFTDFLNSRGIMPTTNESSPATLINAPSSSSEQSELIDKLKTLIGQNPSLKADVGKLCHLWKAQHQVSLHSSMKQAGISGKPGSLVTRVQSKSNLDLN